MKNNYAIRIFAFILLIQTSAFAQLEFKEAKGMPLVGVWDGSIDHADVDNDGDIDFFIGGRNASNNTTARLYINDGFGNFSDFENNVVFDSVFASSVSFTDINNDGLIDLFISGRNSAGTDITQLYINITIGGVLDFIRSSETFTGIATSPNGLATADVNGDGFQDLVISGVNAGVEVSKLYINNQDETFTESLSFSATEVLRSSLDFADVDGDSDLDLILSGRNTSAVAVSELYLNSGSGAFTQKTTGVSFDGIYRGYTKFMDIDNDSDQDIILTGENNAGNPITKLYLNDGSANFTELAVPFENLRWSSISVADIDKNGDMDVLITGLNSSNQNITKLYTNTVTAGTPVFTEYTSFTFDGVERGESTIADVNNNGELDIIVIGENNSGIRTSKLYRYVPINVWTGATDTDWNTTTNWSTGVVPTVNDFVEIPNVANQPVISNATTANVLGLDVESSSSLDIDGILNTTNEIINEGIITFRSTSTYTGQLDNYRGNYSGTGDLTVERYIPAKRTFRFLSSAVGGQSFADAWQQDTHITGVGGPTNGFDDTQTDNPSLFTFDNGINPQTSGAGWQAVTSTSTIIDAGTPYRIMVRGDRSTDLTSNTATASETTLRATGDMHTGNFSPTLATAANNYSFVGNPYQSVVDINETTRTNLTNFIYVWDASIAGDNGNGGFVTVDLSTGTPSPNSSDASEFVAPGQAFFVQNTAAGNGEITFEESDKSTASTQVSVFNVSTDFYINSRLYKSSALANNEMESDAIGLRFNENYTTLGSDEDAGKLGNPGENYVIFNNGLRALDFQNIPTNGHVVELALVNYEESDYSLTFDLDYQPENLKVYLNDTYLNTQVEIAAGLVYDFTVDSSITESVDPFRFNISFEEVSLSNVDFNTDSIRLYPNPVASQLQISLPNNLELIEVRLINLLGKELLRSEASTIDLNNFDTGVYLVKVKTNEGVVTKKIIKQ